MPVFQKLFIFLNSFWKADTAYLYLHNTTPKFNWRDTFRLSLLVTTTSFLIGLAISPVVLWISGGYSITDNNNIVGVLSNISPLGALFLAVFLGPLTEELGFRGFVSTRKWVFVTGLLLGLNYYLMAIYDILLAFNVTTNIATVVTTMLLAANSTWAIRLFVADKDLYHRLFKLSLPIYFWLSLALFGLIHLVNYTDLPFFLVSTIIVLPQFVAGLWFMFARVHYGVWSAFVVHAIHNFIISGGLVVLLILPIPKENIPELIDSINQGVISGDYAISLLQSRPIAFILMMLLLCLYMACGVVFCQELWKAIKPVCQALNKKEKLL